MKIDFKFVVCCFAGKLKYLIRFCSCSSRKNRRFLSLQNSQRTVFERRLEILKSFDVDDFGWKKKKKWIAESSVCNPALECSKSFYIAFSSKFFYCVELDEFDHLIRSFESRVKQKTLAPQFIETVVVATCNYLNIIISIFIGIQCNIVNIYLETFQTFVQPVPISAEFELCMMNDIVLEFSINIIIPKRIRIRQTRGINFNCITQKISLQTSPHKLSNKDKVEPSLPSHIVLAHS